jgi:glycosyltransferase involved in cell wall biosynthesis
MYDGLLSVTSSVNMSNHVTPAVSVCIPCYRGAAHLGAAIASVLAQTWTDFELIIIDDNSPDNTDDVVAGFDDPRIRYLKNPQNLGPEGNWNRCLDEARGRFFKLLPQDDLIAPTCLEKQVAVLETDREHKLALVFCARTILDARDRAVMVRGYPKRGSGVVDARALIRQCVRRGTNVIGEPGSVLFRRDSAALAGRFDASIPYVLDLDYWVRLLCHGDAWYVNEALASFRVSVGSWSVRIGTRQSLEYQQFIRKLAADPRFRASRPDILVGKLMAKVNALLRSVLYRVLAMHAVKP